MIKGEGDNGDIHFEDTVRGSDWGADQEVVRMFVNTAPKAVRELAAWGLPWSRVQKGDRDVIINGQKVTITERNEPMDSSRSAPLAGRTNGGPVMFWTAPGTPRSIP